MNSTQEPPMYTTSSHYPQSSAADGYLAGFLASGALVMIFGIIVFALWIWSLVAMINLNIRFKAFLDVYIEREAAKSPDPEVVTNARREVVVEPLAKVADNKQTPSWLMNRPSLASLVILSVLVVVLIGIIALLH